MSHPRPFDIYSLCRWLKGSARLILRWGVLLIRRNTGSVWPSPFFPFLFLGKGKPKCFHVSDLKICCSIRTFTNFTALLSLATPGVHRFRSTTCLSGHYGHARADGKMYFPLRSTLHYVFLLKISFVWNHHVSCLIARHFSHCDLAVWYCYVTSK